MEFHGGSPSRPRLRNRHHTLMQKLQKHVQVSESFSEEVCRRLPLEGEALNAGTIAAWREAFTYSAVLFPR